MRLHYLFLLLLALPVLAAPDWTEIRLEVEPGTGLEGLSLNQNQPEAWPEDLGEPTHSFRYDDTGEGYRRYLWGEMKAGQLHKGVTIMVVGEKDESSIIEVTVRRARASVKDSDLFLGLTVDRVKKRSKVVQKDGTTSYQLPGLALEASKGKITGLSVESEAQTRWRFTRWTVRAGRNVGPIRIGDTVDETLWRAIGRPHQESKKQLSWRSSEGGQRLVIDREPRSGKVTRIKGYGIPWKTDRGVTLGDSLETYKAKHPNAKEGVGRSFDQPVMKAPGLRATFDKNGLVGFDLFPIPKH